MASLNMAQGSEHTSSRIHDDPLGVAVRHGGCHAEQAMQGLAIGLHLFRTDIGLDGDVVPVVRVVKEVILLFRHNGIDV